MIFLSLGLALVYNRVHKKQNNLKYATLGREPVLSTMLGLDPVIQYQAANLALKETITAKLQYDYDM